MLGSSILSPRHFHTHKGGFVRFYKVSLKELLKDTLRKKEWNSKGKHGVKDKPGNTGRSQRTERRLSQPSGNVLGIKMKGGGRTSTASYKTGP